MKFKTYKPKTKRIRAIQFTKDNAKEVNCFLTNIGYENHPGNILGDTMLFIPSLSEFVRPSDWIIDRTICLEICSDAKFRELYEEDNIKSKSTRSNNNLPKETRRTPPNKDPNDYRY